MAKEIHNDLSLEDLMRQETGQSPKSEKSVVLTENV